MTPPAMLLYYPKCFTQNIYKHFHLLGRHLQTSHFCMWLTWRCMAPSPPVWVCWCWRGTPWGWWARTGRTWCTRGWGWRSRRCRPLCPLLSPVATQQIQYFYALEKNMLNRSGVVCILFICLLKMYAVSFIKLYLFKALSKVNVICKLVLNIYIKK